jgi:hypothetical protein
MKEKSLQLRILEKTYLEYKKEIDKSIQEKADKLIGKEHFRIGIDIYNWSGDGVFDPFRENSSTYENSMRENGNEDDEVLKIVEIWCEVLLKIDLIKYLPILYRISMWEDLPIEISETVLTPFQILKFMLTKEKFGL